MKKLLVTTVFCIFSGFLFGQDYSVGLSYESLTKLQLKYYRFYESEKAIGVSYFYHFGSKYERQYSGFIVLPFYQLTRSLNQRGHGIALHYVKKSAWEQRDLRVVTLEYAHLASGLYYNDPGQWSGNQDVSVSSFRHFYNNLSIFYEYHLPKSKYHSYFYKVGLTYKSVHRHFQMSGPFTNPQPDNTKIHKNFLVPTISVGICLEYRN